MKIGVPRVEERSEWSHLVATITWESQSRPPLDLYFAVPTGGERHLREASEAFVTVCLLPALWAGETRLSVEAPVCPIFLDGLRSNLATFRRRDAGLPAIELEMRADPRLPGRPVGDLTGMIYSGGVHSQFTLLRWTDSLPPDHPARIKMAFIVDFDEFRRHDPVFADRDGSYPAALSVDDFARLSAPLSEFGTHLYPVRTNLRALADDADLWRGGFGSAAMAAVGHAVSRNLTDLRLPVTDRAIDWSAYRLQMRGDTERFTRLAKIRHLLDWPAGLATLWVCEDPKRPTHNCGRCGKCLSTRLALLCLGQPSTAPLTANDLTPDDLAHLDLRSPELRAHYEELVALLGQAGRDDLRAVIDARLTAAADGDR